MSCAPNASLRQHIRHTMRARRLAVSDHERQAAAQAACQRLLALPLPSTVAVYLPIQGELDTWPMVHALWARGARVLAPRCRHACPGEMDWYAIASAADLAPGSFGIPEPDPERAPLATEAPGLVLVPGLAFDRVGFRLGYGGGYYDRYLAAHPAVWSIGLAYDFQVLEELPAAAWDRPVHALLTPSAFLEIRPCPR